MRKLILQIAALLAVSTISAQGRELNYSLEECTKHLNNLRSNLDQATSDFKRFGGTSHPPVTQIECISMKWEVAEIEREKEWLRRCIDPGEELTQLLKTADGASEEAIAVLKRLRCMR